MRFHILGPLRVHGRDGGPVQLDPRLTRLLATLLLAADQVVTRSRLIEAVWDQNPPDTVERQLRNLVSALRGRLAETGGTERIVFDASGYRIVLNGSQLDAQLFADRLLEAEARRSEDRIDEAARQLREGLALWRGPALDGCTARVIEAAAAGLNEQRMTAIEQCLDLEIRLGYHHRLISELTELVTDHPTRERLVGLLMLALYRSGRQADAINAYRGLGVRLSDDLGCDPGRNLQELHVAILRNDPSLLEPAPRPAGGNATNNTRDESGRPAAGAGAASDRKSGVRADTAAHTTDSAASGCATDEPPLTATTRSASVKPTPDSEPQLSDLPTAGVRRGLARAGRASRNHPILAGALAILALALVVTINAVPKDAWFGSTSAPGTPGAVVEEPESSAVASTAPRQAPNPQAQPPLAITTVNPIRQVLAHGGSPSYIFEGPADALQAPPEGFPSAGAFADWAYDNGGVDADSTDVQLIIQGRDARSLLVTDLTVIVTNRHAPPAAVEVEASPMVLDPGVPTRYALADLDESDEPIVEPVQEGWLQFSGGDDDVWDFPLRVSQSEPEDLRLRVETSRCDCTWVANLHFTTSDGASGIVEINNGGEPFRTVASADATTYFAQPDGSLKPAQQ